MGEENTSATASTDIAQTAGANKTESQVITELTEKLGKLENRLKDQESFIGRQTSEIGELRKKTDLKAAETVTEATETKETKPFFETLPPQEQDAVKVYMRETFSKLPDDDKKKIKETLKNAENFNELAKEIHAKIKTPKYVSDVLGDEPVKKVADTDGIMSEIKVLLRLADSEKTDMPPSGGSAKNTKVQSGTQEVVKRKYPNGGILNLTK